jgi:hypothetical protein
LYSTFAPCFPEAWKKERFGLKQVKIPYLMDSPEDISFSIAQLGCNVVGLAVSVAYAATKHFLLNNALGLSYSLEVRCIAMCCTRKALPSMEVLACKRGNLVQLRYRQMFCQVC